MYYQVFMFNILKFNTIILGLVVFSIAFAKDCVSDEDGLSIEYIQLIKVTESNPLNTKTFYEFEFPSTLEGSKLSSTWVVIGEPGNELAIIQLQLKTDSYGPDISIATMHTDDKWEDGFFITAQYGECNISRVVKKQNKSFK